MYCTPTLENHDMVACRVNKDEDKDKDTVSSLCPPMKRNCYSGTSNFKKARNITLPTNACSPSPFSKGDGNQRHPEHKKREVS